MKYNFKDYFKPSGEFTKKAKGRFLAAFDVRYGTAPKSSWSWTSVLKPVAGVLVVAAVLFSGASFYADAANVPADNILYPLKRLGENVQLAVAPTDEKAQLQATFAQRRVDEISDLETRKPSSTIITALANAADTDVNASINDALNTNLNDGNLTSLCGSLFSTIATSSVTFHGEITNYAHVLARFEDKCDGTQAGATSTISAAVTASSTASSTTTASTTFHGQHPGRPIGVGANGGIQRVPDILTTASGTVNATSSFDINVESRLRDYLMNHFPRGNFPALGGDASSTTTITTTSTAPGGQRFHPHFGPGPVVIPSSTTGAASPVVSVTTTVSSTLNLDL